MRKLVIPVIACFILGCGKDDPKPPSAATLVFPLQDSECTTGVDVGANTSEVEFQWQQAANTETYELRVTHLIESTTITRTTTNTSSIVPLEKGAPYSWFVISKNTATMEEPASTTWRFYNAGSEETYAPFPATILSPASGATVARDTNGEVSLQWSGTDVDNDIANYEVYLSTADPPATLVGSPSVSVTQLSIAVDANTIYYWKVITRDREGNTSDSGVYSFRAL